MENTQNKSEKSLRMWLQLQAPRIFALCWFVGGVVIALLVLLGVTSYAGERISFSNAITWILNEEEGQFRVNATKAALGILYFVYLFRISRQLWKNADSFALVAKKGGTVQERTTALSEMHVSFANIFGLAVMHILWARLLTSTVTMAQGLGTLLIGSLVFLGTGLLSNYAQRRSVSLPYILVDTLRNVLAAMIAVTLLLSLKLSAVEKIYDGVLYVANYIDEGVEKTTLKPALYTVYDRIVYPILHMILLFTVISIIKIIWGNVNYYVRKKERNLLLCKFKRISGFGVMLIVLYCLTNVVLLDAEMQDCFSLAIDKFLPFILLGAAGRCLLHFAYPERFVEKELCAQEQIPTNAFGAQATPCEEDDTTAKDAGTEQMPE